MTIIATPSYSDNLVTKILSPAHPLWDNSSGTLIEGMLNTYTNWWSDTTPSPNTPDTFYSIDQQANIIRSYVQYGQNINTIWSSAKALKFFYTILNEVVHSDNSVTFDFSVLIYGASHAVNNPNTGYSVVNTIKMSSTTVFTHTGTTKDTYNIDPNSSNAYTFTGITLAPRAKYASAQIVYQSHYPNGEFPDATINLGVLLTNPLYPFYTPMTTRKSLAWKTLNSNGGHIQRRVNGVWTDFSVDNQSTENQAGYGHTRRRTSGTFIQLPKLD